MLDRFSRTEMLLGKEAVERLKASRVAVIGIGGVGGYAAEALARSGVGALDLVDSDKVDITNINRQIIATESTLGMYKADAAAARIAQINPECKTQAHKIFYMPETAEKFDFSEYDYIIDAIDTVTGKIAIVENAYKCGTSVISAMGAGNKLDPTAFIVADIYSTSVCPLAKVMRRELKKRGIQKLKVVYSQEQPLHPIGSGDGAVRTPPGSVAFVPSVAGLILAGEVIKDIACINCAARK